MGSRLPSLDRDLDEDEDDRESWEPDRFESDDVARNEDDDEAFAIDGVVPDDVVVAVGGAPDVVAEDAVDNVLDEAVFCAWKEVRGTGGLGGADAALPEPAPALAALFFSTSTSGSIPSPNSRSWILARMR